MMAAPLTELEAVNSMLAATGQAPVNSFSGTISDQNIARGHLANVVREVCSHGFSFNTDENYVLTPDFEGVIAIPAGAMSVNPMDPRQNLVQRRHPTRETMCLWDKANLTWTITDPVKVRVRWSYTYEALPELARVFAAVKAGRLFLADYVGDAQRERFAQEDEQRAWINLRRDQTAISDINIFDNPRVGRKLIRGRRVWGSE
ncbi:hypothetical protein [Brevundimonas diminuta]|uniref:hypothetical protein n=1 Tax=Brevundimonas diminuta TaxID=293 RepID=UPI001F55DC61|nr:hypothetical protein [Brevundimonas diminuta]